MIEQKVINASQTDFTLKGIYKHIEKCARICYDSEDKITDDSYISFIEMLRKNKHYSPFGHATVAFDYSHMDDDYALRCTVEVLDVKRRIRCDDYWAGNILFVSARVIEELDAWSIIEKHLVTDLSKIQLDCDSQAFPIPKRQTLKITTSIAMTRELNRHGWNLDICERSTRYVKPDEWIKPYWWDDKNVSDIQRDNHHQAIWDSFDAYDELIDNGFSKQQARDVLPLATATECYYTAFDYQWNDVINKRTSNGVHPQMLDLMKKIKKEIK